MHFRRLSASVLGLLLLGPAAWAVETDCPEHFVEGRAPGIVETVGVKLREVCFSEFAVLHSAATRGPLYSAEHLIGVATHAERVNAFHAEATLPAAERATNEDYLREGFDRGHMTPAADMTTKIAEFESFSLANMVPQVPQNNRNLWKRVEAIVRAMSIKSGELFVVTGPIFEDAPPRLMNGRVAVPTSLFKAVYDPATGKAAAYVVKNSLKDDWRVVEIAELDALLGFKVFPSAEIKGALALRSPRPAKVGGRS